MRDPSRSDSELLHVRVSPRASKSEIIGWQGRTLRVRVTAAPVDGAANRAVLALLSERFGVPLSSVTLVKGERERDKLILVHGWSVEVLVTRLNARVLS